MEGGAERVGRVGRLRKVSLRARAVASYASSSRRWSRRTRFSATRCSLWSCERVLRAAQALVRCVAFGAILCCQSIEAMPPRQVARVAGGRARRSGSVRVSSFQADARLGGRRGGQDPVEVRARAALRPRARAPGQVWCVACSNIKPARRIAQALHPLFDHARIPSIAGNLNWDYTESCTPWPTPRSGWATVFARLPLSCHAPNSSVARAALAALAAAGLCGPQRVPLRAAPDPQLLFPAMSQTNDVTLTLQRPGSTAGAAGLLVVSDRWAVAPAGGGSAASQFGNLVELTLYGPGDGDDPSVDRAKRAERALRDVLRGPRVEDATLRLSAPQSAWSACHVPHASTSVDVPAPAGWPPGDKWELRSVTGLAPDVPPPEWATGGGRRGKKPREGLATMWRLVRGGEEVAQCLMAYANNDLRSHGPTIELLAVKCRHRGRGLGRALHAAIVEQLLGPVDGWSALRCASLDRTGSIDKSSLSIFCFLADARPCSAAARAHRAASLVRERIPWCAQNIDSHSCRCRCPSHRARVLQDFSSKRATCGRSRTRRSMPGRTIRAKRSPRSCPAAEHRRRRSATR